jgi:hypothetical protein
MICAVVKIATNVVRVVVDIVICRLTTEIFITICDRSWCTRIHGNREIVDIEHDVHIDIDKTAYCCDHQEHC